MSLILYGLKNCDTCKKALKALAAAGVNVEFVDIRTDADLAALVPGWIKAAGVEVLVNKRSTTWRTLTDKEKQQAESTEAGRLLANNPTLIKRPVIEGGKTIHVGWTKSVEETLI